MRILAVAALLSVAACARAPAPPPGVAGTAAGDRDAARLYRSRCSACHRPYEPSSRTRAQWQGALARMAPKAHLGPPEEERIRAFLLAGASDAGTPGR